MNTPSEALPEGTFDLASGDAERFIGEDVERFGLDAAVGAVCLSVLERLFGEYGGFKEQPLKAGHPWLPYHNASHAACVMAVGAWLAFTAGESADDVAAVTLAGVGHDYYHGLIGFEADERASAEFMRDTLAAIPELSRLADKVAAAILGTAVTSFEGGVVQSASVSDNRLAKYVADADLASLVAPNSVAWALRLQIERDVAEKHGECRHSDIEKYYSNSEKMRRFLLNTESILRGRRYLSETGEKFLQPLLVDKVSVIDEALKIGDPLRYFRADS
jgi:hypothetical protein